ncbi:cupin domain-containing protein [Streptomyces bacillaris]|uniref:cupin domain-containing protein n=1 Tax=Streptomyces TaxID=1883 RepID=UPI0019651270
MPSGKRRRRRTRARNLPAGGVPGEDGSQDHHRTPTLTTAPDILTGDVVYPTRPLPGEYTARHQHEEHQLVYVSDGILAVRTDHGAWVAGAQRAVWIHAHTWHEHSVHGHTTVHTLMFPTGRTTIPCTTPAVWASGSWDGSSARSSAEPIPSGAPQPGSSRR